MKNELMKTEQILSTKMSRLDLLFQLLPPAFFLGCAVFGVFVGMRLLAFIDKETPHQFSAPAQWSESGFEQLQQMNATIKQELDLIVDLRHENQALQEKMLQLAAIHPETAKENTTKEDTAQENAVSSHATAINQDSAKESIISSSHPQGGSS